MMKINDRTQFLKSANKTLDGILDILDNLPILSLENLSPKNTVLISLDIINGFVKIGNLASERVNNILPNVVKLHKSLKHFPKIFMMDQHTCDSVEFEIYPPHCLKGSDEGKIVDELIEFNNDKAIEIYKNSTNGFLTSAFSEWLKKHTNITNFIVVGDCTDICIKHFSLTLNSYFHEKNIKSRILIPIDCVETFDLEETYHNGDLMNIMSLYEMKSNGIELYKGIK